MNRQKHLLRFSLLAAAALIAVFALAWNAPTSGAYLTWEATTEPIALKIGAVEEERITITTLEPEIPTQPTAIVERITLDTPVPIHIPATVVEVSIEGNGLYDAVNAAHAVSGRACLQNSGANPTLNLSPLRIQVMVPSGGGGTAIAGAVTELAAGGELAPGEQRCFAYQMAFQPQGRRDFSVEASVTIHNFHGWLPGTENCPQQSPCPHQASASAAFTLPGEAIAPTAVIQPPALPTPAPAVAEEPAVTEVPVVTEVPAVTEVPVVTEVPAVIEELVVTAEVAVTEGPVITEEPPPTGE